MSINREELFALLSENQRFHYIEQVCTLSYDEVKKEFKLWH